MIKAHKIRLNPTPEQEIYFRKAAGTARFVFNWALAKWKCQKVLHPGEQHGVLALKKDFNALKPTEFPWVYEVAKDVADGVDNGKKANQKISNWSSGKLRNYIEYKAAAEGIRTMLKNEAYTSQICPNPKCLQSPAGFRTE